MFGNNRPFVLDQPSRMGELTALESGQAWNLMIARTLPED